MTRHRNHQSLYHPATSSSFTITRTLRNMGRFCLRSSLSDRPQKGCHHPTKQDMSAFKEQNYGLGFPAIARSQHMDLNSSSETVGQTIHDRKAGQNICLCQKPPLLRIWCQDCKTSIEVDCLPIERILVSYRSQAKIQKLARLSGKKSTVYDELVTRLIYTTRPAAMPRRGE